MAPDDLAQRLLDAHVAWTVDRLSGDALPGVVDRAVDDVLAVAEQTPLAAVVTAEQLMAATGHLAATVPASAAASTVAASVAQALHDGPGEPATLRDVVDRDLAERIVDEVLAHTDLLEHALDDLTASPEVATMAARFLAGIVQEVVQTNRAVAERIPGVGSLMSLGANAAGMVIGAAQIDQLVGGTAGKGAAFAMGRLNAILLDTLRDPATRRALLDAYELYADRPLDDQRRPGVETGERIAGLAQDVVIEVLPSSPVQSLVRRTLDHFLGVYGDRPAAELLADAGITRDHLVAVAGTMAPQLVAAAQEAGVLEQMVRAELEPFYTSAQVRDILRDALSS